MTESIELKMEEKMYLPKRINSVRTCLILTERIESKLSLIHFIALNLALTVVSFPNFFFLLSGLNFVLLRICGAYDDVGELKPNRWMKD